MMNFYCISFILMPNLKLNFNEIITTMVIADLYIRVSTDEQAEKGYSQRDQNERLRKYCESNNILINKVIYEDHSAKSFERPEWKKYLIEVKKRSHKSSLVLFTKWDRFSRNTGDAYQMISLLQKNHIIPQAIEQPLDMSVPENKLMLAIYLSTPEVENDRRALNTFHGMRRAKKEGRLMGIAPYGYINRSHEDGKKYIAIKEPEASNIIWAFNEISKGYIPADHVRLQMNKREGVSMSRSAFAKAMRNPVYCGKIYIEDYKQEEAYYIDGKHEPLVSEKLFNQVQRNMDKKRKIEGSGGRVFGNDRFPLRGLLTCPRCGKNLTASGAKGKSKTYYYYYYYYYYHCHYKCGFRFDSDKLNELFEVEISKLEYNPIIKDLMKDILLDNYKQFTFDIDAKRKSISKEINDLNEKVANARDKYLADKLDEEDYKEVKKITKEQIEQLEQEIQHIVSESKELDIKTKIENALDSMENLANLYQQGDLQTKRTIGCLIFPQKIEFDGKSFQTPKMNIVAQCIYQYNNGLGNKKTDIREKNLQMSV
ncbi:recombinase family protein [Chryseobacterium sp. ES2]|uniref:Recombinase family protein n=1 Tax=Chryseobacterium metallicongregator TaxID=3073042 RepID=A0ABU1E0B1_9FLAO|nr:recombinase family protein [Chryseobacterium sp. ES2]MDR4951201.1 recombinase family protein [Chryseobacterium sp. ES2]